MSSMTGQQVYDFIENAKKSGQSDMQIYDALKRNPSAKANFASAKQAGMTDKDIAKTLGLSLTAPTPKVAYEKPSLMADIGSGMDRTFSGVRQGLHFLGDKWQGVANNVLGTKFDTGEYDRFTKAKADERATFDHARQESGKGFNIGGLIGETVAMGHLATAGRGYQGLKVLSKAGAKVTAQNAGLGAVASGVGFAKDSDERVQNMTAGAMLAPAGAIVGKKIGEQISKRVATTPQNVDISLNRGLAKLDLKLEDLPDDIAKSLRADAKKALKAGRVLDDDAIARKAFLQSKGFTPTHAQVSRNATDWTNERELAKMRGTMGMLTDKYVDDNAKLVQMLDDEILATGGKKTDDYVFNQELLQTAQNKIAQNKAVVSQNFDNAKNASGNDLPIDGIGFANDALKALDDDYLISSLPSSVSKIIKDIQKNPSLLTLGKSQELIKVLNREYKATLNNGQPTSETHAIKVVRDMLENRQHEAVNGLAVHGNDDAIKLWNTARASHKANRQMIESMPLLQDAEKGVQPDKMFKKHILGGNVEQLRTTMDFLRAENPQLVADIKQSVLEHIADKSVNGTNGFSPAGMKKALDSLGGAKLKAIFSDDEIKRLKDMQLAGELLKQAPFGSNVNHSNTASALSNIFGMMIDKVPFANMVKAVRDYGKASSQLKGSIVMPNVRTVYDDDTVHYATKAGFGMGVANSDE